MEMNTIFFFLECNYLRNINKIKKKISTKLWIEHSALNNAKRVPSQLRYFSPRNVSGNSGYIDNLWNSLSTLVAKDCI